VKAFTSGIRSGTSGVHAVILGIAEHRIAGASKFSSAVPATLESSAEKTKSQFEIRREVFHDQIASGFRNRRVEMPFHDVRVSPAGRTFRRREIRKLKPRI